MVEIDKGKPVPGFAKKEKLPFDKLEQGDSFFLPDGWEGKVGRKLRVYIWSHLWYRRTRKYNPDPHSYTTRLVEENGVKGIRVWRMG